MNKVCIWEHEDSCDGEVVGREFFMRQVKLPVCEKHVYKHKMVMFLYEHGEDIEEILCLSPEDRESKAKEFGFGEE